MMRFIFVAVVFCFLNAGRLAAQPQKAFDPLQTFAPIPYPAENNYRTAAGMPAADYWQNRSNYRIQVALDTTTHIITGTETIDFFNNSPDKLSYLWILLDQNRFKQHSVASLITPIEGNRFGVQEYTNGFVLKSVRIRMNDGKTQYASYDVNDAAMKLLLPQALAHQQKLTIYIAYSFQLPVNGSDYMGILSTRNGAVFQCSVWYPRVSVYDDVTGWTVNADSYYTDPGTVDYTVTLPANMFVAGSGQLMNPSTVLSAQHRARLQSAMQSDTPVLVRPLADVQVGNKRRGQQLSWHFNCVNTSVAFWAASAAFIWDAVKINLPHHRSLVGMSFYVEECNNPQWKQSTALIKRVIESYSSKWTPYPYLTAVSVAGSVAGLAGSGITFIDYSSSSFTNGVWAKENHEFGHNWFPGIIRADERKYQWMSEGFNSFINDINGKTLNTPTAFDMETATGWLSKATVGLPVATQAALIPISSWAMLSYMKPAIALHLLRTEVIGEQRFDKAFRSFMVAWQFKHPTGPDFFRAMDNACGEDLSWFWRSWFLQAGHLDQAIQKVVYSENDPAKGINITISNNGQMVMPVTVQVIESNGNVKTVQLPVQIWRQAGVWTFHYASVSKVMRVTLDPGNRLPDMDRTNNYWSGNGYSQPLSAEVTVQQVIDHYFQATGGLKQVQALGPVYIESLNEDPEHHFLTRQIFRSSAEHVWELSLPPMALQKCIVTDSVVYFRMLKSQMPLTELQQQQLRFQTALFPELDFFKEGFHTVLKDSVINLNGADVYQVSVNTPWGDQWMYYYDAQTGLKLRETLVNGSSMFSPFTSANFGDYRKTGEWQLPWLTVSCKDEKWEIRKVQKLLLNRKEEPGDFDVPGK